MSCHRNMARLKNSFAFVAVVAVIVVLYLVHHSMRQPADVQTTPEVNSDRVAHSHQEERKEAQAPLLQLPSKTSPSEIEHGGPEGIVLPQHDVIDSLGYADAASLYHQYVNHVQYACPRVQRLGNQGDGGWELCLSPQYRPTPPCLVYSFGINNDFSFDDAARATLGCDIHCFDPSMGVADHVRAEGIIFHNLGLANFNGTSNNWTLLTLQATRAQLGHSKVQVSVVKMDIEGMEWDTIPEMLVSGGLAGVRQFVLEVHVMPVGLKERVDPEFPRYTRGLHVLRLLYDFGFRIFFTHQNAGCNFVSQFGPARCGCHEIFLVRVK